MKNFKFLLVIFAAFCFTLMPVIGATAAPVRYTVSPSNRYINNHGIVDWIYPDYVVEFDIPANASEIVTYTTKPGAIEGKVFGYGRTYYDAPSNGRRKVKFIAGYRARHCSQSIFTNTWNCDYRGSIYQFADTVRLRYYL